MSRQGQGQDRTGPNKSKQERTGQTRQKQKKRKEITNKKTRKIKKRKKNVKFHIFYSFEGLSKSTKNDKIYHSKKKTEKEKIENLFKDSSLDYESMLEKSKELEKVNLLLDEKLSKWMELDELNS